jgi:hypothetical protein
MCGIDWGAIASWMQAIFSIVAIVAAIVVAERSAAQSRGLVESERKRQADIVASMIAMRLGLLATELETRAGRVDQYIGLVSDGHVASFDKDTLSAAFVPTQVQSLLELRAHILMFDRDSGIRVATVMDLAQGLVERLSSKILIFSMLPMGKDELFRTLRELGESLVKVAVACREAETALEEAHALLDASAP